MSSDRTDDAPVGGALALPLRRAGIDTYHQPVLYLHQRSTVCRAEGFEAMARVEVRSGGRGIIATLNTVSGDWLGEREAALSEAAWRALASQPGERRAGQLERHTAREGVRPSAARTGAQCPAA